MNPEATAQVAAQALYDKQAESISIYDVREVSNLTDITVVATGTSGPHLKALFSSVQRTLKDQGVASYRVSGAPDSGWVVLDYVHVVVHLFSPEAREYYAIERLWAKAKALPPPHS